MDLTVVKDRSTFTSNSVSLRTDSYLTYPLHSYTLGTLKITEVEQYQNSYNKLQDICKEMGESIMNFIASDTIQTWATGINTSIGSASGTTISGSMGTSGTARPTLTAYATGTRKAATLNDLLSLNAKMTKALVPTTGRVFLCSEGIYNDIITFATNLFTPATNDQLINSPDGFAGKFLGWDVILRPMNGQGNSKSLYFDAPNSAATMDVVTTSATTNSDFAILYHPDFVSVAYSTPELFSLVSPADFGTVVSIMQRAAASRLRSYNQGVNVLYETWVS